MRNVQDLFRSERENWLLSARATARKLLDERYYITIEDVLEQCPRPKYIHPNATGSVFNSEFASIGWGSSRRKEMNGRAVRRWRLKHAPVREREFADVA